MSDFNRQRALTAAGLALGAAGLGAAVFAIFAASIVLLWLACCVALAGPVLVGWAHKPKNEQRQRGFEVTIPDRNKTRS
jgi:hypothetical protein